MKLVVEKNGKITLNRIELCRLEVEGNDQDYTVEVTKFKKPCPKLLHPSSAGR
jgi:hypothetical protein